MRVKRIPGYDDKYLIREDGRLYRHDFRTGDWKVVSASGDPPRVRLYAGEEERRIYVHVLLQELFRENY
jgi:hypothetical protein